ncbi:MAG: toxin TcdB middle/N-terminal domain-containing protein, partial [Nanoarchaeota archaeon]
GMTGSHNVISVSSYNYSGGKYDYQDREFRGFNYVEEKIINKVIKHWFNQSDPLQGREYRTDNLDNNSNLYNKLEQVWNFTDRGSYFVVDLLEVSDISYDNVTTNPRIKNTSYTYDIFGNINRTHHKGDVNNADDDKYEYFEYLNNSNKWIVNKIKNYTLTNTTNNRIRNTRYIYDNQNFGQAPINGSLTAKQDWLDNGNAPTTNYTYNSFGNIINETDANGHRTDYFYGIRDTTNTFVDRIMNNKSQITDYNYEPGIGKLLWQIDSNGMGTNYSYDVFGRIIKEVKIYDNQNFPTKNYSYEYDGVAPEEVKISYRETNNTTNTYDEYSFYDGFGNIIQTKKEAENSQQIVSNTFY